MGVAETQSKAPEIRTWRFAFKGLAAVAGFLLIAVLLAGFMWWPTEPKKVPGSVSLTEYAAAEQEFSRMFGREASEADVMMLLAENAVREDRPALAVDCFAQIPSDHRRYGASARFQEAQVLLRMNEADKAELSFRTFLKMTVEGASLRKEHVILARKWLVFILAVELRFEERKEILRQLLQDQQADVYDAKQYYFPSLLIWQSTLGSSRLSEFLELDPANHRLLTAQARYFVGEGNPDAASRLLKILRQKYPADATVIVAALEACYEQSNWREFDRILSLAPAFSDTEPWLLSQMRGESALHNQDWTTADSLFRHVLKQDPSNPACHMGLAKALNRLGRIEEQRAVQERSLTLARIRVNLTAVNNSSATAARELASDARSLQMNEAAAAFELLADRMSGSAR